MGIIDKVTGKAAVRQAQLHRRHPKIALADARPFERQLLKAIARIGLFVIQNGTAVRDFMLVAKGLHIRVLHTPPVMQRFKMAERGGAEQVRRFRRVQTKNAVRYLNTHAL